MEENIELVKKIKEKIQDQDSVAVEKLVEKTVAVVLPKLIQDFKAQYSDDISFWPYAARKIYDDWLLTGEIPEITIDQFLYEKAHKSS